MTVKSTHSRMNHKDSEHKGNASPNMAKNIEKDTMKSIYKK